MGIDTPNLPNQPCPESGTNRLQDEALSPSGQFDACKWRPDPELRTDQTKQWASASDARKQLPVELDSNCMYEVQFGDSLDVIAQRYLRQNGMESSGRAIKDEVARIVDLNKDRYKSLDCNDEFIRTGWKLKMPEHRPVPPREPEPPRQPEPQPPRVERQPAPPRYEPQPPRREPCPPQYEPQYSRREPCPPQYEPPRHVERYPHQVDPCPPGYERYQQGPHGQRVIINNYYSDFDRGPSGYQPDYQRYSDNRYEPDYNYRRHQEPRRWQQPCDDYNSWNYRQDYRQDYRHRGDYRGWNQRGYHSGIPPISMSGIIGTFTGQNFQINANIRLRR